MRRKLLKTASKVALFGIILSHVAFADSTVPNLAAGTSLLTAKMYLANAGAADNSLGLITSVFDINTGALTLKTGGVADSMLASTFLKTSSLGTNVATFLGTPTSANFAAALTDETGTGAVVFGTGPTLVTPTLGAATATSVNKVAITAPASSATLTIADGKTLTDTSGLGAVALKGATGGGFGQAASTDLSDTSGLARLATNQSFTAGQAVTPTTGGTQAAGGTLTPDFSLANSVTATFGAGNLTIANPTNVKAGQSYVLALTQDGVGSRTVTWGANFKWAGGTAPTLSTGASAKDIISCWADTTATINCTLAVKGAS